MIPEQFRRAPFVFLANIDPRLQLQVLDQVEKPRLVLARATQIVLRNALGILGITAPERM